jgi:site-specific DNA-methyltransferase (adenine-specific)
MPEIICLQQDSLKWMAEQSVSNQYTFDLVFTDPPYDSLLRWQGIGTTARMGFGANKDATKSDKFYECIDKKTLQDACNLMLSLLKSDRHLYVMCDPVYLPELILWFRGHKDVTYVKPLVWDKQIPGMGYHWRSTHEYIIFCEKGRRRLNNLAWEDILRFPRLHKKGSYPTEKPYRLVERIILNSTKENDWVLDPFCGSGVTGEVCLRHNRNCVLLDKNPRAIEITKNRIESARNTFV